MTSHVETGGFLHRVPAIVFIALATLAAGCNREPPKPPPAATPEVTLLTVVPQDVAVSAVYVAQTQSSQSVNIQARVSGFLDKRLYTEGAVVKAGQVLFQMDQKPFAAQVAQAKAALQRNQAAADVAKANLARTKPLAEQNALSQKDLDDAQGQYEQAVAAVEQSKAQLTEAELNLSYTTIRSPVTGVASYAQIAEGTYLSPANSQLTTVSVLSPMWINFSISENELERVRNDVRSGRLRMPEGGRFVVQIEMVDGTLFPYTGRITFADPSFNPATGTFLLRATVENLNKRGIPLAFAFVYDEFWQAFQGISPLIEAALGTNYKALPDFWVWCVMPSEGSAGWGPHRDKVAPTLDRDNSPHTLTVWLPLSDATPLNGCIYMLPAHLDERFKRRIWSGEGNNVVTQPQDVRALPATAGSVLA